MANLSRNALALALLSLFAVSSARAEAYKNIAKDLARVGRGHLSELKIAILPFDYVDGRQSPGGRVVAENLIVYFTRQRGYTVIERVQVEKLLQELKFQRTGLIDATTMKEIGRGLGVPAIVTGAIQDLPSGAVLISAKLIETETFKVVGATQEKVKPTWSVQSSAEEESMRPTTNYVGYRGNDEGTGPDMFADIFFGYAIRGKNPFGIRISRLKRWGGFDLELSWKLPKARVASDFLLKIPITETFFPYGGGGLEWIPADGSFEPRFLGGFRVDLGTVGFFAEYREYDDQAILGGITYRFPH